MPLFTRQARTSQPVTMGVDTTRHVQYRYPASMWTTYVVSVAASWVAEVVTYPLDLTKTRLQIQGELASKKEVRPTTGPNAYRGMFKTATGIMKEEGVLKLWHGISAQFLRHSIYSGTRIIAYQFLRDDVFKKKPNEIFPLWKAAICGMGGGIIGQFLANPADLVKVQLQMEGKRKLMGLEPRVHSLSHALKQVVVQTGFTGLWKGSLPNMQRAALVNLGDLTTYDTAKRFILRKTNLPDDHTVHVMSSFCAGFVAAAMGTPADVIKTRVMHQPIGPDGKPLYYRGSMHCLMETIKCEGVMALYKGFIPIWLRMAPWSLTFWLSYEEVHKVMGIAQF